MKGQLTHCVGKSSDCNEFDFCILKDNFLHLFHSLRDNTPALTISLEQAKIRRGTWQDAECSTAFRVTLQSGLEHSFKCPSNNSTEQWLDAIEATSTFVPGMSELLSVATDISDDDGARASGLMPTWVPDPDVIACYQCTKEFGLFSHRHHCRNCGRIFCRSCCNTKMSIPTLGYDEKVKVCNECVPHLQQ